MSDNKAIIKKSASSFSTILSYSTISIVILMILANLYGIYYVYSTFQQITTPSTQSIQPDSSILVSPLNTTLYKSILKDRQSRITYTQGSPVPTFSYNEVFAQPQPKSSN